MEVKGDDRRLGGYPDIGAYAHAKRIDDDADLSDLGLLIEDWLEETIWNGL